jgi:hypothetical protein
MDLDKLYEELLPVWRDSYFRQVAVADHLRWREFGEVEIHAKYFLDLHAVELPEEAYYGLAERLADEVRESVARPENVA